MPKFFWGAAAKVELDEMEQQLLLAGIDIALPRLKKLLNGVFLVSKNCRILRELQRNYSTARKWM